MGFVTTGNQFGHFKTVLSETGVDSLDIRSSCDGMLVEPGDTVCSETLALMQGTDGFELQCRYADLLGQNMKARTHQMPPIGWCSWYYYFSEVTQADIALNVAYLAEHREQYPLRYIQLDDGYQSVLGDWLCCNDKFPDGLEVVARMIRTQGFLPALWVAPFLAEENSALLRKHPDWMIHDEDGKVILQYPWRTGKAAILDGTNPEVLTHLKRLFARIREMGFDYVKLDFLIAACTVRNGVLHDSKATRAQALRRGLEAIREGFGEDGFILGCTVPFGASVGVVDGKAYPIIEIAPIEGFYDYTNKYKAGSTVETCPAVLTEEQTKEMQKHAEDGAAALGIENYCRLDFMMRKDGRMYCLEANTLPGMTPTSLLPQEAAVLGMDFPELCELLIQLSLRKRGKNE